MESGESIQISPEDEEKLINTFIQTEIDKDSFESSESLNIAVIGKTGVGKSSFINAFRQLTFRYGDEAKNIAKQGACIKGVHVDVSEVKYEHKSKIDNVEIKINFFDSMGFMDIDKTNIQTFLIQIGEKHKIGEFDAIIFVSKERISDDEMSIAKLYEKTLLFFIYNQMDEYLEKEILLKNGKFDKKKSFDQLYEENKDHLIKKLNEREQELVELIDEKNVLSDVVSDIEHFTSSVLKSNKYKEKIIRKSIYFITSNADDFGNPAYSRDGERIRKEIEEHLARSKLDNLNINLLDPFSDRLIYMKKKSILRNIFKGSIQKLKVAGNGLVNMIPFLDTLISKIPIFKEVSSDQIKESFRTELMKKFGIQDLRAKLTNSPNSFSAHGTKFDEMKMRRLNEIIKKIDSDEVIMTIDSITESSQTANSSNITEKLKDMVNKILPAMGIGIAGLADDIGLRLGPWFLKISKPVVNGLAVGLSIASIPVSIVLYAYLLEIALEKILLRYEEYALLLFEVIHN